jgi:hypothetical protein
MTVNQNVTEIIPNLWVGDIDAALSLDFIKRNKISCIVNCTDSCPFIDEGLIRVKKIRIPIRDNGRDTEIQKMYSVLDKAVTHIYGLLRKHRILVHCLAGRQRSVAIILAFLMKYAGFTLQEAIDSVRKKKAKIGINFSQALVQYQMDLGRAVNLRAP